MAVLKESGFDSSLFTAILEADTFFIGSL